MTWTGPDPQDETPRPDPVYPDDDVTPEIDEDGDEGDIASGGAPERPDRQ